MSYNEYVSMKIHAASLAFHHKCFECEHFYDSGAGRVTSTFGFIVNGKVEITSGKTVLRLGEGSLFFIPHGVRHKSVWTGEHGIEFYGMDMSPGKPDADSALRYEMTYLGMFSDMETLSRIRRIYTLAVSDDEISKARAISGFFDFYADTLPYIRKNTNEPMNPVLVSAIGYIEKNFDRDFDVAELASYCHVSISRLHHLFRGELAVSPIRYRNDLRIDKALELLRDTDDTIDGIAGRCGFNTPMYFREMFRNVTGMTPAGYRKAASHASL